jgi:hypothetical protein
MIMIIIIIIIIIIISGLQLPRELCRTTRLLQLTGNFPKLSRGAIFTVCSHTFTLF